MAGRLEPIVAFWTGWGVHFMVVVSFTVQVTLLLLADIRRRKDWAWLKVILWLAYTTADTAAVYALGHMAVACTSPEHRLMALWAPLLLVYLGGQDNITAYAIEDNRLWLRHLLNFVLQVVAAGYVLHVSSILYHPMSSKVTWAAILMFVVGVLKYGERIWALKRANSGASSSLSATSYSKVVCRRTHTSSRFSEAARAKVILHKKTLFPYDVNMDIDFFVVCSLLDVPKQMFEGPTSYVQISSDNVDEQRSAWYMWQVVQMQLWMMYDLLYTKAAVVHTWYGLFTRVLVFLPFTVAALLLFCSALGDNNTAAAYNYDIVHHARGVDVTITKVLLSGAVVVETMSMLRAIFSRWTAVLLMEKGWYKLASLVLRIEVACIAKTSDFLSSDRWWSGRMRQHQLFGLKSPSSYHLVGSESAKWVGLEDWWDSNVYSWSTDVRRRVIDKVQELVSTSQADMMRSQGLNAVRRSLNGDENLAIKIWTNEELKLDERILVWHIATHVYISWCISNVSCLYCIEDKVLGAKMIADYMFYLLAARPYMLPYPVSRHAYVQLCSDVVTDLSYCSFDDLKDAVVDQKDSLMQENPLCDQRSLPSAMNTTLSKGCQLAAKLIDIIAEAKLIDITTMEGSPSEQQQREGLQTRGKFNSGVVMNMVLEVWVEMLCHAASWCNENSHAKHLTDGGEIMTILTLLMIYTKNGFMRIGRA